MDVVFYKPLLTHTNKHLSEVCQFAFILITTRMNKSYRLR
uniref:Uncharacterized protein n=1 Tax=Arundo donax TaxID=35708 RepID=A0A0A9BMP4_ARUDO